MYVLTGYRRRNTADPTEHIFGFDFPARSFFFEFLNKLLINDIEATSGNRNTFFFEMGGLKNFWGIEELTCTHAGDFN